MQMDEEVSRIKKIPHCATEFELHAKVCNVVPTGEVKGPLLIIQK